RWREASGNSGAFRAVFMIEDLPAGAELGAAGGRRDHPLGDRRAVGFARGAKMAPTNPDRRLVLSVAASLAAALGPTLVPAAAAEQATGGRPLKIGIIGAGREGGALGTLLVKAGHPVMFSSRHPEALKGLVAGLGPLAAAGTVAQAIDFGDVVMIIVP